MQNHPIPPDRNVRRLTRSGFPLGPLEPPLPPYVSRQENELEKIWREWVLSITGASAVKSSSPIQSLWGGMGEILRVELEKAAHPSVVLKRVRFSASSRQTLSETRKRHSYDVESQWYTTYSKHCPSTSRVASHFASLRTPDGLLLLLEDLGDSGFEPKRPPSASQIESALTWLAHFHAHFLDWEPEGLWEQGCYWHLETRPDELRRMPGGALKNAAAALDGTLRNARFQTLVHGDAKPANFMWNAVDQAAAVDFQYVGRGCGIRDVAYFLDCSLGDHRALAESDRWQTVYFRELKTALLKLGRSDGASVEAEWRALFPVAWSDFNRFYQGWAKTGPMGEFSRLQFQRALELCRTARP